MNSPPKRRRCDELDYKHAFGVDRRGGIAGRLRHGPRIPRGQGALLAEAASTLRRMRAEHPEWI